MKAILFAHETRNSMNRSKNHKSPARLAKVFSLLVLSVAVAAGCGSGNKAADDASSAPRVAVVEVTRRNLATNLEIASEFQPFQEIDVYAKVSGYIQKLYVDWGSHVKQGQLLAVLEIPELQQQLQADQAAVLRSQQDVERTRQELVSAQSSYEVAHVTYSRLAGVQKNRPELISQQDIDVAKGKDLEGSAGVAGAKDAEAAAENALDAARAVLAKDQALFSYARMTAPFDGVVTRMNAYTGALLPAGTTSNVGESALCHLSQNDVLRLVIPVPERVVAGIHLGQEISVNVSALKKTFTGKVIRYADQIDVQTRTMHTEVQVANPSYEIVPGMYADVQIPIVSGSNVLAVPIQSVETKNTEDGSVLVVNSANEIQQRNVKLGVQTANYFEILSGLQEHDRVIFGEQNQYHAGMKVTPQLMQPAAESAVQAE
jgi:RND family efflux transporter MFP subunit